ncbi:MAG TPA: transposase [Candidatus Nitrosocosmicus sp.]
MWWITLLSNVNVNYHPINLNWKLEEDYNIYVDKIYNFKPEKQGLIKQGYVLYIPYKKKKGRKLMKKIQKRIPNRKKHSPKRWVVERTNSWHNRFRKLFTRYEKKVENYLGWVQLSCCIII